MGGEKKGEKRTEKRTALAVLPDVLPSLRNSASMSSSSAGERMEKGWGEGLGAWGSTALASSSMGVVLMAGVDAWARGVVWVVGGVGLVSRGRCAMLVFCFGLVLFSVAGGVGRRTGRRLTFPMGFLGRDR